MNKKKIYKILSSTISGLYLINTASVFAQENVVEDTIKTENSSSQSSDNSYENNENIGNNKEENIENKNDVNQSEENESEDIKEDIVIDNEPKDDNESLKEEDVENVLDKNENEDNPSYEYIEKESNKDKESEHVEDLKNNDNSSNAMPFVLTSSPVLYKPTINYKDGIVSIADNGLIPGTMDIVESFDNTNNVKFDFTNKDWIIADGVMKSCDTSFITTNKLTLVSDFNAEITIKVRVSSASGNTGSIYINSNKVFTQSGPNNDTFTTVKSELKKGENRLEFSYYKSSSTAQGLDAMIIDEIKITTEYHSPTSDRLEYRINGGNWTTYTEPFACGEGDKVEARSVYSSLYSDISVQNLNIIDVPDVNLVKAINKILGKSELSTTIYADELNSISGKLNLANSNIIDLSGIDNFTNVTELIVDDNEITDITPIKNMTNLQSISAKRNKIENIESIKSLQNLISIDFEENNITDIAPIEVLSKLASINFKNNKIDDEAAFNVVAKKSSLEKVTISLVIPSLDLKIGEGNSFNSVAELNLEGSKLNSININKANNLKQFRIPSSVVGNINITNCSLLETINLMYIKANDVNINNITSKLYIAMNEGNVNSLNLTECTDFDNLAINRAVLKDLYIENLSSKSSLYMTLDGISAENVTLNNINSPNNPCLNSSDVKIGTMIIKNVYYSNVNMVNSSIDKLDISDNVTMDSIGLYSFQTSSDLNLGDANFKEVFSNNMKAKSIILKSSPRITYISLDGLTSDNVEIENCALLSSVAIPNGNVKNISAKNLSSLKTFDITAVTNESCVVDNCPNLTTLTNTYNKNKGIITNLTLSNLNSITELTFPRYDIENVSISNCNNVSKIDLSENKIKDISQIKSLNSLININISDNFIIDISPLKNISSLNISNIEAFNQSLELDDVLAKEGDIKIDIPNIIDYSGDIIDVKQISDKTKIGTNKINLGKYTEGIYDKVLEFESKTSKYSVNASQKLIVDGTIPTLSVKPNTDKYTNKNVLLTIKAEDVLSGIDYIKLPNGDIIKDSTYTFEVENNGSYEFEAVDLVGNSVKKSITISNIDKVNPVADATVVYNTNKTEAIVKITATDVLSGVSSIILPDGKVIEDKTAEFLVKKNDKYTFIIRDNAGNTYNKVVDVTELVSNNSNNNNNVNSNESSNDKENMPNTGGVLPLITTLSVISLLGGLFNIKRKQK